MHLDDDRVQSSLLLMIREQIPAAVKIENEELLDWIAGYPGNVSSLN